MSPHPVMRTLVVAASTALLVSALAGPSLAKPDKEAKAAARAEAKAERKAEKQARAEARAEAKAAKGQTKAAKEQAKAERKAEKQAARQAKADAKADCRDGGWEGLATADGDAFPNQGQCVKYAVHGGSPTPPETVLVIAYSNLDGTPGYQADGVDVLISQLVDTDIS